MKNSNARVLLIIGAVITGFGVLENIFNTGMYGHNLLFLWIPLFILDIYFLRKKSAAVETENLILIQEQQLKNDAIVAYKKSYKSKTNVDDTEYSSLPPNKLELIKATAKKEVIKDLVKECINKNSMSPVEWQNIQDISSEFGITLNLDSETQKQIEKLLLHWKIENEKPTPIKVDISLQKDEECFYKTYCNWHELRTTTKKINYSAITGSVKIMKGVRFRMGSIKPQRITSTDYTRIDSGYLFVTNKRIIFMGDSKNVNIKYSTILSITPYSDGVKIEKDSGKSPLLFCSDGEILAHYISVNLN